MKMLKIAAAALVLAACHQPTPAEIAKAQADQRVADQAAAAQQAADDAKAKAEAQAAAAKQAADARAAHEQLRAAVNDRLRGIYAAANPCDEAGTLVAHAMAAGDRQALYEAASNGKGVCQDASTAMSSLKPPEGVDGKARDAFAAAYSDLGTAEFARADALESLAKAVDAGDMKPSAVADMKQSMQLYQQGLMSGLAKYLAAASDAGVKPEELNTKPNA